MSQRSGMSVGRIGMEGGFGGGEGKSPLLRAGGGGLAGRSDRFGVVGGDSPGIGAF